jgi:hypothetical protein
MAAERRFSMSRPSRVRRLALLALIAAAGCQDYNFNPVGHCVVQPGAARVKLSDISTADVLFVVDDSGSMGGKQASLAANFDTFITNLDTFNKNRASSGQTPIDFHVAITTTSVFLNNPTTAYCKTGCPNAAGGPGASVCCRTSGATLIGPLRQVQRCAGATDTSCGTGGTCTDACGGYLGEFVCCNAGVPQKTADVPCDTLDAACGDLQTHYAVDSSCKAGVAVDGEYYPHGAFVGAATNPRVLHFDKSLYWDEATKVPCVGTGCVNGQNFTSAQLKTFFEQNALAGTCGSGQEQGLQASQLAVQKAVAGQQLDTYPADSGTPAATPAAWLHPNAKLVLVYVGDEDDCSSPEDATSGVILVGNPGADACVTDQSLPPDQQKETQLAGYVSYFSRLQLADGSLRPLGAAFIVSANPVDCQDASCVPGICIDPTCTAGPGLCGGLAPGTRFLSLASQFKGAGADVVEGSICSSFGTTLDRIADIVKPPGGLVLPTEPASGEITVLRIVGADGKTRKTCYGPAPAGTPLDANGGANDGTGNPYDWWFTAKASQETLADKAPTGSTRYVYINHSTQACEASPGETYSADYLGRLPTGGCYGATAKEADDMCVAALGGRGYHEGDSRDGDWTCYAGMVNGKCQVASTTNLGTCICGQRGGTDATPPQTTGDANCPQGSMY